MRVIECNECGETISAANDEELAAHLADHLRSEHDKDADEAALRETVARQGYDATDS